MGELRHTPTCSPLTHRHGNIVHIGWTELNTHYSFFPLAFYYRKVKLKRKRFVETSFSNLFTEHIDEIVQKFT